MKLCDFGIAKLLGDAPALGSEAGLVTTTGAIMGTPMYLAPELLRGARAASRDGSVVARTGRLPRPRGHRVLRPRPGRARAGAGDRDGADGAAVAARAARRVVGGVRRLVPALVRPRSRRSFSGRDRPSPRSRRRSATHRPSPCRSTRRPCARPPATRRPSPRRPRRRPHRPRPCGGDRARASLLSRAPRRGR